MAEEIFLWWGIDEDTNRLFKSKTFQLIFLLLLLLLLLLQSFKSTFFLSLDSAKLQGASNFKFRPKLNLGSRT